MKDRTATLISLFLLIASASAIFFTLAILDHQASQNRTLINMQMQEINELDLKVKLMMKAVDRAGLFDSPPPARPVDEPNPPTERE